jgi:esterase
MQVKYIDGDRLSYLDAGGTGAPLIALHGHLGRGRYFAPLAGALAGSWRLIALDQRGHGRSRHMPTYKRQDYLNDLATLMDHLGLEHAVLLGFSLGGANAYQFAARHPRHVRALIIEDIGAVIEDDLSFIRHWPRRFESVRAASAFLAAQGMGSGAYFMESLHEYKDGWGFCFDAEGLIQSQQQVNGDWWADWLATTCPALVFHGGQSDKFSAAHAAEMAARRPHTQLVTMLTCGHGVLHCDFEGYRRAITAFLDRL